MQNKAKILIVDDEADVLELLAYNLEQSGYEVIRAHNGAEGVEKALKHLPDLIILDLMMPVMDGIQACEAIRREEKLSHAPVVFLTARGEEYSELAGFEAGADDYIVKPIKPRILLKRIKALLKRGKAAGEVSIPGNVLVFNDLEINKDEYTVKVKGIETELTRREFELLFFLASKPGKLFSRQELLDKIWENIYITDRTVDVHVRKLREKVGPDYISTVKGVGYKFVAP